MRALIAGLTLLFLATPQFAAAQPYPNRPVRLVVPYAPGGANDALARILAEQLRSPLGQPVIVENRPGASGNVGLDLVAKSPADGYTLVITPSSITYAGPLFKATFDPFRDFTPVVMLISTPVLIGGGASLPVTTIGELVDYARAHPGKLAYSSCGSGGPQHLAVELLKSIGKIDMVHVPFKGCGPAIVDVLGGQVQAFTNSLNNVAPHLNSGKLRGYGVTTAKRSPYFANIPTVAESGYPDFEIDNWLAILGPGNLPRDIVTRLNAELNRILEKPEVRERFTAQLFVAVGGPPEVLADAMRRDEPKYLKLIRDLGIRAE